MHHQMNSDDTNTHGRGPRGHREHDGSHGHGGRRGHGGPRGHGRRGGRPAVRPVDPEASELELVQHLARRLRRGSALETAPWGISPHQARALAVIARATGRRHRRPTDPGDAEARPAVYTGLRLGALAEWLEIAPRSATEVVDGLEELGLVARTPDPEDRRAVLVGLTDRGREVARELRAARRAPSEQLLEVLSAEDRAQLRTSLLALIEAADADR